MSGAPSLRDQANAVARMARPGCIKVLRPRGSEADLLLEHLKAAAATLARLAAEQTGAGGN